MADNLTVQSTTLASLPVGTKLAARSVTYSGDSASFIGPTCLTSLSGSDDAKTATDVPLPTALGAGGGLKVDIVGDAVANVAHDAADSGGPNKIGGRAVASVSAQTAVAANDRTDFFAGVDGVLIMRPDCNLEDIVTGTLVNTDGASTSLIASSGAGIKTYLRSLDLYNSSGAGVVVELKDGTTVKKTFYVPTVGGLIRHFDPPLAGTAATAWNIDAAGATTTLYANAEGFKSKL